MSIKITLDDGTTIECETATIAKEVIASAAKGEAEVSGATVRYRAYRDALQKKLKTYGSLEVNRTAVNGVVKMRLIKEFDIRLHSIHLQSYFHREDIYKRAMEILDEILPSV